MKLEVVPVPVADVDRAKAFYVDQIGFNADHDHQVNDDLRFVQLTPPGSQQGLMMVVADAQAAHDMLVGRGVEASEVDVQSWGSFVYFSDPDGNTWALQQLPSYG